MNYSTNDSCSSEALQPDEPTDQAQSKEEVDAAVFPGDMGMLPLETRRVIVQLLLGPAVDGRRQSNLWATLLRVEAAIRQRLHALGLEPQAVVCGCTSLDDATEAAVDALWDGATLNHAYSATQERLQRWLDGAARLPIDQAARESFFLGGAAISQLVYDPLLPEPMVDAALRQAFIDSVHAFDAAGRTIWNRFYDTLPVPDTAPRKARLRVA